MPMRFVALLVKDDVYGLEPQFKIPFRLLSYLLPGIYCEILFVNLFSRESGWGVTSISQVKKQQEWLDV